MPLNKKKLILLSSITSITSIVAPTIALTCSNELHNSQIKDNAQNNSTKNNVSGNKDNSNALDSSQSEINKIKPLIESETNYYNPRLSTKNGPITFWGNKITSVDWFGAERWSKDVTEIDVKGKKPFSTVGIKTWNRNWMNFDLDKSNGILYILNNAAPGQSQTVVSLNVVDGSIIDSFELKQKTNPNMYKYTDRYFTLSVLEGGNVLVFGQQGHAISKSELIDIKTKTVTQNKGDLETFSEKPNGNEYIKSTNYLMNLIPIGVNRNIAITYNMTSKGGTTNDNGKEGDETSRVEFILCDDKMNAIKNSDWIKPRIATKAIPKTQNSKIWPQRDWYKLLDGRIVTIIYDKLFVFSLNGQDNATFTTFTLDQDKWIESWSFDTNEKLYFKSKDESIIQTVTLDPNKGNNHTKGTYYDLSNSKPGIKEYASSFSIFNVYGYAGQIMIINSYFHDEINNEKLPIKDSILKQKYGLAVAITNQKNDINSGDTKGLLNTEEAFQKSADFTIEKNILDNKLPSEITRQDLKLLNDSFFTQKTEMENNQLKYEPFSKDFIDDSNKELTITVNIDQIPWFVTDNKMPNEIKPLKITKKFNSTVDINNRFRWKNSDKDDYDFKNTLPSKVTEDDLKRISPLVSTLSSQKVTISGEQYPKTTYRIKEKNDSDGSIKIEATYSYLPMDTKENSNNIKTYTSEKTYHIFNKGKSSKFSFIGNGETDIGKIPALKELKEANLFPSKFDKADKQEFLKFIDTNQTDGYPLEKMKITVNHNDSIGTLTINVNPKDYDSNLNIQSKTYTGLNKKGSYNFDIQDPNKSEFDKSIYRPSDITNEIIFKHFAKYSGFDSSDLKLELNPNNESGSLGISIYLISQYPKEVIEPLNFKEKDGKYVFEKTLTGFKNNASFNSEYRLDYKDDTDISLLKIKEKTPATILNAIGDKTTNKSLVIGNKTYKDKYELAKEFVKTKGSKIPNIENSKDIEIDVYANNSGGELTWSITFKKLTGYPNSLTFIQKFTGFARGNDDITSDILTFKNTNQLFATNSEYKNKKPSEIEKELINDKTQINKFLLGSPTGDYKTSIDKKSFTLDIKSDDIFGTLTISIKFNRVDIKNEKSLLEYSQTFSNLSHYE